MTVNMHAGAHSPMVGIQGIIFPQIDRLLLPLDGSETLQLSPLSQDQAQIDETPNLTSRSLLTQS